MQFKEVLGNGELKGRLIRMVDSGRTGHSIMLVERDGYGALPLALALIQYMICGNRLPGGDSCGVCPACRKIAEMVHPDLHFAFPVNVSSKSGSSKKPLSSSFLQEWRQLYRDNPYFTEADLYARLGIDGKAGAISVAEAREILDSLSLKSYEGKGKYMIIWLPERMNAEAANRLLKIVEEEELVPVLQARSGLSAEEAAVYARTAGGSLGLALDMAGEGSAAAAWLQTAENMLDAVVSGDLVRLLEGNEAVLAQGRERQKEFCLYMEALLRRMMLRRRGLDRISDALPQEAGAVERFSPVFPDGFYEKAFKALEEARTMIEANVNAKMVFCHLANILFATKNF